MKAGREDEYLAVALDDYGCPPICSGSCRLYAGTAAAVEDFLAQLAKEPRVEEYAAELRDAYGRYRAGERDAQAEYYLTQATAFRPLTLLGAGGVEEMPWSMEFVNAWSCLYSLRADRVSSRLWYGETGGRLCRFVASEFQNAVVFNDFSGMFDSLWSKDPFWGHPAILDREGACIFSRLAYLEREFDDRAALEADVRAPAPIDHAGFFFDVFGDG